MPSDLDGFPYRKSSPQESSKRPAHPNLGVLTVNGALVDGPMPPSVDGGRAGYQPERVFFIEVTIDDQGPHLPAGDPFGPHLGFRAAFAVPYTCMRRQPWAEICSHYTGGSKRSWE